MLLSQAHVSGVFNAFAYQMFLGTVARAARVDPGSPASSMSSTSSIESEEEAISARRPVTQYNGEPPDYWFIISYFSVCFVPNKIFGQ